MIMWNIRPLALICLLMLLSIRPALADDIMFGEMQFRATVGTMSSSAAYVSIMNHGKTSDRLLEVTSALAKKTELHIMEMNNGVMKMRQIEGGINIPAGKTVQLAPGGYHVMLMGLKAPLKAGESFEITLVFEHAGMKLIKGLAKLPAEIKVGNPSKMHNHNHDAK